jgi:hypothetical protein
VSSLRRCSPEGGIRGEKRRSPEGGREEEEEK